MGILNKIREYIQNKIFGENKFQFYYNLGIDYYAQNDYENAINYFRLAAEQEQIESKVYYNLALSYQSREDYDRAIVTYNKFLEFNPEDYDGLYNLALVYSLKENYLKAIEFFEKCVEIRCDLDSITPLISAHLKINQTQKAINVSEKVLEKGKGLGLYYEVAKIFENKNTFNKDFTLVEIAIEMFLYIIKQDPSFFEAYLSTSICYAKKGEWEKSVEYCKMALEKNPKSYDANNQMGLVYYCCDEIKESIKCYEAALNLKPDGDYKIYANLGYAYEKFGQTEKAINIFTKLISKFPNYPAKDEIKNHIRILKSQ